MVAKPHFWKTENVMTYWKDKLIKRIQETKDPLILKEMYWLLEESFRDQETYKMVTDKSNKAEGSKTALMKKSA